MHLKTLIAIPLAAGLAMMAAATLSRSQAPATSTALLDPDALAAADALFDPGQGETRAVTILRGGRTVYTRYAPGYSDYNRFISWSMAKSVTAVLVGELVADGRLSLDAPVPFAEWQKPGDPRAAITLRQLLHMSSGLKHEELGDPLYTSDTNRTLFVDGTEAMAARALAMPLEAPPGKVYEYSSLTSLLLSELVARTLDAGSDPRARAAAYRAFAEERLFRPAGISSAVLEFDAAGTQVGGSIIYMSLPDWGRFGQVLLTGRGAGGEQVIDPAFLSFLRTPSASDSGYGGHVWLNRPRSGGNARFPALFPGMGPASAFAAVGHLGQYVIASPEQDVVVVRLGKTQDDQLQPVRDALGRLVVRLGPAGSGS